VNTTPHGRSLRLRKPALAAISVVALGGSAVAPAQADAQSAPPTIKLKASKHRLLGKDIKVRGLVPGEPGQRARIMTKRNRGWRTAERVTTGADGRFSTTVPAKRLGRLRIRVLGPNDTRSEKRRTFIYRRAHASYYGPGLYGNKLACGGTLTPSTIGVAHKSLPCGTRVVFRHRGRTVQTRVIDRGPYVAGREYDLTEATKHRLRFGSTGLVKATK
jgi:rare lipoprotein A (peptidoglycan hydrolase)